MTANAGASFFCGDFLIDNLNLGGLKGTRANERIKKILWREARKPKWKEWCGSLWLSRMRASSGSARLDRQVCHRKCFIAKWMRIILRTEGKLNAIKGRLSGGEITEKCFKCHRRQQTKHFHESHESPEYLLRQTRNDKISVNVVQTVRCTPFL